MDPTHGRDVAPLSGIVRWDWRVWPLRKGVLAVGTGSPAQECREQTSQKKDYQHKHRDYEQKEDHDHNREGRRPTR